MPRTFRLSSNEMVHAPGIVAWAINGYAFKKDRPKLLNVLKAWQGPTDDDYRKLLNKEIPYTVEDEVVVFSVP